FVRRGPGSPGGLLRLIPGLAQGGDIRLDLGALALGDSLTLRSLAGGLGGPGDAVSGLAGTTDDDTVRFAPVGGDLPPLKKARLDLNDLLMMLRLAGSENELVGLEIPVDVDDDVAVFAELGAAAVEAVLVEVAVDLVE